MRQCCSCNIIIIIIIIDIIFIRTEKGASENARAAKCGTVENAWLEKNGTAKCGKGIWKGTP